MSEAALTDAAFILCPININTMKSFKMNTPFFFLLLALGAVLFVSCNEKEINSRWNDNSIVIDGKNNEWEKNLHYLPDEHSAIGIANDSDYLYVCLSTNDSSKIFSLLRTGFTIWIESEKNDENIGIQYPLKPELRLGIMHEREPGSEMRKPDFHNGLIRLKNEQQEIRIVNEDNFPLTAYHLKNEIGLDVNLDSQMGLMVYEMRIPISKPLIPGHNLELVPGERILLKFESGEFERPDFGGMQKPTGFDNGSMRSGNPPGGKRGQGGFKPIEFEKIDFSVAITLASHK